MVKNEKGGMQSLVPKSSEKTKLVSYIPEPAFKSPISLKQSVQCFNRLISIRISHHFPSICCSRLFLINVLIEDQHIC